MKPSDKLSKVAQDRLNLNTYKNFVIENLPEGVKQPPSDLTCRNCTHANWTSTIKEVRCHCLAKWVFTHTKKDEGEIVICDRNIPNEPNTVSAESSNDTGLPNQEEPMNFEITAEELALMTGEELITDETDK